MPPPSRPSPAADRAFLLAVRAFGGLTEPDWARVSPRLAERVAADWEFLAEFGPDPNSARAELAGEVRDARRPDLGRIHRSWLIRALREQSPAVRRLLAARAPEPIPSLIAKGFGDVPAGLDHAPDPNAKALALALWAERLVGDRPERPDDPPVLSLFIHLDPRAGRRLLRSIGRLKLAALGPEHRPSLPASDLRAVETLRSPAGVVSEAETALVRADLAELGRPDRRVASTLGLTTVGRLLAAVDPYRLRWAVQHQPYEVARPLRAAASRPLAKNPVALKQDARWLKRALAETQARTDPDLPGADH